jgi:hypothetical protein
VFNVFGLKSGNKSSMSEMIIVPTLDHVVCSFMSPMILEAGQPLALTGEVLALMLPPPQ